MFEEVDATLEVLQRIGRENFGLIYEPETVRHDPPFQIPSGGAFDLTCDWNNTTGDNVGFGTSVDDEMCFFWAYYFE